MMYMILDKKQIMMASNNVNSNVIMVMHDGILDFGFYQIWSHLEDRFRWNILDTSSSDSYPHFIVLKLKRELRKIKLGLFIYILKCCFQGKQRLHLLLSTEKRTQKCPPKLRLRIEFNTSPEIV